MEIPHGIATMDSGAAPWEVDFELGEDIRTEERLLQDAEWAGAIQDGRAHLSHRELAMVHAPRLLEAIMDYNVVEELVNAMLNYRNSSRIRFITPELLRVIVGK